MTPAFERLLRERAASAIWEEDRKLFAQAADFARDLDRFIVACEASRSPGMTMIDLAKELRAMFP